MPERRLAAFKTNRRVALGVLGTLGVAGLGHSARAQAGTPTALPENVAWSFTDDRGMTIEISSRPERIVAFSPVAAALWDLGRQPVGVFGPFTNADGAVDPQAGSIDPADVTWLGLWDTFDLEKLLALEPDLLVGLDLPDVPNTLWHIPEDIYPLLSERVPTVGFHMQPDQPTTAMFDRVEDLAVSLGVDLTSDQYVKERAAFEAAASAVTEALGARSSLTALAISADAESVFVANPTWFSDLRYFQDLGLEIITPETPDGRWQEVSWEQIGQYQPDLFLVDARSGEIPPELAGIATWASQPAVKAGQVAPWFAVYPYGRKAFTPILERLAEAIRAVDPAVES
ncbi:MAG: ABC transporter substrate-binding protein [Thermomicrobiales bacterium]|nr:ABC transporter substrate-binding protein [Thermomicrobiales bacterium]